ncbi:Crp/Fnr family transcriptional regulator [Brevibacillus sp. GCM10020057]|uniref:Crp/Fnr family transcriptional regulator n=1 Tax=Brevibacillus sp. GCM10020057 TaxID=3317327 RepID=UPI00362623AA
MKEHHDLEQVRHYLRAFQMDSVFSGQIQSHLSLYSFEQGEKVCTQGEAATHLYVLVKGKLKIYTTSAEGRTLILSFKTPLELIGDIEYVRGTDIVNTVEAVSPVLMLGIQHRWLRKYGEGDPQLLQFLLDHITKKFYAKSSSMSFNLLYPVEVRLASYLLSVSFDDTDAKVNGQLHAADMVDVAHLIGTSYRHLNRVLRQFVADGLVERQQGAIVITDRDGLRALAGQNVYE